MVQTDGTTSHALLAQAFASRGFTLDRVAADAFFARQGDRVHGVWGTLTDRSAHAAVVALRNPNSAHELLAHGGVPILQCRAFNRYEKKKAQEFAAQWGRVAVHGGTHRPIMVDAASEDAFAAAWDEAAAHATVPGMRVTRAPAGPCLRVLVAHGTVVAVREEAPDGTAAAAENAEATPRADSVHGPAERPEPRTALAAVAALPGLDLAEVVVGPTPGGAAVLHLRADPELTAFGEESGRGADEIAETIVSLHLGVCAGAAAGEDRARPVRRFRS